MTRIESTDVVIVGRPNVGKSTLFNRIVGRRRAIVGKESGLTRDRHVADAEWCGRQFRISDTGGVEWQSADELLQQIQKHALASLEGARLIIYVVDSSAGIVAVDARIVAELRRAGLPLLLAVNKCDNSQAVDLAVAEFHQLGIDTVFGISAEHGVGVGDLLDEVIERLPDDEAPSAAVGAGAIRVAVIGRPNVGKSSLVNALLGTERVVVSSVSGTTRDAIDTPLEHDGQAYVIVDTAGIRRAAKRESFAEYVSVEFARRSMARADVAILVIDANVGLSRQDVTLANEAAEAGCALVVAANKWDLVEVERGDVPRWRAELADRLGRMQWARSLFVSAKTGYRVERILPMVREVRQTRARRVPTAELNRMFDRLQHAGYQGPPGAALPKYLTQTGVDPPRFVLFVRGQGRKPPASYARFVENRIRGEFGFEGTPIRLHFRRGRAREERARPE